MQRRRSEQRQPAAARDCPERALPEAACSLRARDCRRAAHCLGELVQAAPDAIFGLAPDGCILSWNPAAERLFGVAAAEVVGRGFAHLVGAASQQEFERRLAGLLREAAAVCWLAEGPLHSRPAALFQWQLTPILAARRRVRAAWCVCRPARVDPACDPARRAGLPALAACSAQLRPRERQIVRLLAEGRSSRGIAALLQISPRTVDAHRRNIAAKLDLHSVAELTKYAVRAGLSPLET